MAVEKGEVRAVEVPRREHVAEVDVEVAVVRGVGAGVYRRLISGPGSLLDKQHPGGCVVERRQRLAGIDLIEVRWTRQLLYA